MEPTRYPTDNSAPVPKPETPAGAGGRDSPLPKWAREIQRFLGVKSQFVLSGNVYDVYPLTGEDGKPLGMGTLETFLTHLLQDKGYRLICRFRPYEVDTLLDSVQCAAPGTPAPGTAPTGAPALGKAPPGPPAPGTAPPGAPAPGTAAPGGAAQGRPELPQPGTPVLLERLARLARDLSGYHEPSAVLVEHASRLPELCAQEYPHFLYQLFRLSMDARARDGRFPLVIWSLDKENDLPPWYRNARIMHVPVPRPDHEVRRRIIRAAGPVIKGFSKTAESDPDQLRQTVSRFADQTGGLYARELASIAALAAQDGIEFARVGDAVRHYKLGVPDNPWDKLDRNSVLTGGDVLSRRVLGQKLAVDRSLDIIKRSVFDLSGSQFSAHSQKPKGILFFAGPTGVVKTELAKGITELVFGSPENYVRFDMSEFNQPHSDQRLMGAPPGYVGYETGGELTNAVRQKPFTLVLFDEIEKAHHRIMDIFLQILDDGRLTSGRGETAYFTDAILVFTSNLGIYRTAPDGTRERLVSPDMPYCEVEERISGAIRDHFTFTLNRPEILNRIGKNIVVFDFIRPGEVAKGVFRKMLGNVLERLRDTKRVELELDEDSIDVLCRWAVKDLSMGGRGIGNSLEECFVNPLSRELYSLNPDREDRIRCHVADGAAQGDMPKIRLTKEIRLTK
jgi:hypothetical protein